MGIINRHNPTYRPCLGHSSTLLPQLRTNLGAFKTQRNLRTDYRNLSGTLRNLLQAVPNGPIDLEGRSATCIEQLHRFGPQNEDVKVATSGRAPHGRVSNPLLLLISLSNSHLQTPDPQQADCEAQALNPDAAMDLLFCRRRSLQTRDSTSEPSQTTSPFKSIRNS